MDRTYERNASIQPPAPPAAPANGYPTGGDPQTGIAPTKAGAWWYHMVTEELSNLVGNAGITPSHTNLQQLSQAIQSGQLNSAVASGAANALEAIFSPPISQLVNGLTLHVRATLANTGSTPTFTPAGGAIPPKTIVRNGNTALLPGDIAGAGHWLTLKYDQPLDKWILLNPLVTQASFSYLNKPITVSNNTSDPNNDIDFSAGSFTFSDYSGQAVYGGGTGQLDVLFGSGNGMLATGSKQANSTYHLFMIYNPTTNTSKPLAILGVANTDPNPTSVLPSGYTKFDYIASLLTDASGNIRNGSYSFDRSGSYSFEYNNYVVSRTPSLSPTTATLQTIHTPIGIKTICELETNFVYSSFTYGLIIDPSKNTTVSPTNYNFGGWHNAGSGGNIKNMSTLTNKSSQVSISTTFSQDLGILTKGFNYRKI